MTLRWRRWARRSASRAARPRSPAEWRTHSDPAPKQNENAVANPAASLATEISAADARTEVEWLAAPERDGRMTGSKGAQAAAEWFAAYFPRLIVATARWDFLEPFEFNAGVKIIAEKNGLSVGEKSVHSRPRFSTVVVQRHGIGGRRRVFAGYGTRRSRRRRCALQLVRRTPM
jgi:hypothetical protein